MKNTSRQAIAVAKATTTSLFKFSDKKAPRAGDVTKLAPNVADTYIKTLEEVCTSQSLEKCFLTKNSSESLYQKPLQGAKKGCLVQKSETFSAIRFGLYDCSVELSYSDPKANDSYSCATMWEILPVIVKSQRIRKSNLSL
uniref:Uncharacterized protein n=1 Tax=Romanomermis culicivorax TaxID=13658 RepID=A0A915JER3_ROMCU